MGGAEAAASRQLVHQIDNVLQQVARAALRMAEHEAAAAAGALEDLLENHPSPSNPLGVKGARWGSAGSR
jgi:hypothetical protein